jgi:hypothetical protein
MFEEFNEDGLSFRYPRGWTLERENGEDAWTVSLQSPGTAFALIRMDRTMPDVEEVAQTALDALKADYPKLEAESVIESIAGEVAIGHDIEFFSLDLLVTCWIRCFFGMSGTVLILCQVSGVDQEENESALRALCASMRSEE